jgi:predicted glycogen debranching enzyme
MNAPIAIDDRTEWLEADGLGGFASGTTGGLRTRRYHALLLAATTPPTGRMVLVNGVDVWIERPDGSEYLTRQRYAPGVVVPETGATLESFSDDPWPAWTWRLRDGIRVEQELFVTHGSPVVAMRWRLLGKRASLRLAVRPFLSGRDSHSTHHENPVFRFSADVRGERVTWHPYDGVPAVEAVATGYYTAEPEWYRNFQYREEQARGLDAVEDLAAPGVFRCDLDTEEAVLILGVAGALPEESEGDAATIFARLRRSERTRRARFASRLDRSADAYIVQRGEGKTIVAGYPWFTDWGRDTFISLRGLCLATDRLADARSILLGWASLVSEGMLPNRFIDQGDAPEFNTVDASLWYIVAIHEYLSAMEVRGLRPSTRDLRELGAATTAILAGHIRGTRYGIRAADDGLLAAGEPGVQLTWMDAKVGDWVVTPRIGKPVEVQALWLNALRIAGRFTREYEGMYERGLASFHRRFWYEAGGFLYDVVDADHVDGRVDASLRPNQILAVGGLPFPILDGERARQVVDVVERALLTPLGLRTLAPGSEGYRPVYEGDMLARDGAYHQGTVWPWLLGPFVEAWVRVHGGSDESRRAARQRFLEPLLAHLSDAGVGHISEIADAEPPFTPRGCPFQAWSVAEALRLDRAVLAVSEPSEPRLTPARATP